METPIKIDTWKNTPYYGSRDKNAVTIGTDK